MADRIHSIDSMRIIAMVFVVIIHTNPFAGLNAYGNTLNFALETSARFAVPFFFVTSGYFLARSLVHRDPHSYLPDRIWAISSLYVFGIVLTFPVFTAGAAVRAHLNDASVLYSVASRTAAAIEPADLFYYGTSVSEILWFLPALAFSYLFIYGFIRIDGQRWILPVAAGIHVIGLLGASYTMFIDVPFRVRDGLFFGFFYTSLGYAMYSSAWAPDPRKSARYLALTVVFAVFHLVERYTLGYVIPGEQLASGVYAPSYTIGTALLTLSLFVFLLSRPSLTATTSLPAWGSYAVGVYVVHPSVLSAFELLGQESAVFGAELTATVAWHLFLTPAVFFGSLLLYIGFDRLGVIEIGGSHLPSVRRIRNTAGSLTLRSRP